jgi:hypothetical protein
MASDESIKFHEGGGAVVTVLVDKDLGQWLCRQSVVARTSVGIFVKRLLMAELVDHAKKVREGR